MIKQKSYGLDIIRIVAAMLVFIPHLIINFSINIEYINIAYVFSSIGVELFFCLSGYLICKQGFYITNSSKYFVKNATIFVKRRILRTWPAYFFVLLAYIFFYRYFESEVIFYLFFVQNLFYPMVSNTFFSVSWSICVEELFYLVFPLLICFLFFFFRKKNIKSELFVISSCLIIILSVFFIRNNLLEVDWGSEIRRVAFFRLDAIAFGGLGYFFLHKNMKYKNLKLFIILISLVFLITLNHNFKIYLANNNFQNSITANNLIFYYMYIFCICMIFLFDKIIKTRNKVINNIISEIANWSYPLYLIHILIIDLVKSLYIENLYFNILLILFISFLCAYIIRKYIELPFLKVRPKYLN